MGRQDGERVFDLVGIPLETFPESIRDIISEFDADRNGSVDPSEIRDAAAIFKKAQTAADGSISISQLPKELHPPLSAFDTDGDGTIDASELAIAAQLYKDSKDTVKKLTKMLVALVLLLAVLIAAIGGLTAWVVESSKETKTDASGITMLAGTNMPSGTATVKQEFTLAELHAAPATALNGIDSLNFDMEGTELGYTIVGWTRTSTHVTLHSARGDKVQVTADGGALSIVDKDDQPVVTEEESRRRLNWGFGGLRTFGSYALVVPSF